MDRNKLNKCSNWKRISHRSLDWYLYACLGGNRYKWEEVAKEKGIAIYDVKNGREINGSIQPKAMAMMFSIAAEIEHDLISKRTIDGLKAARAKGKLLGRPRGTGKSKLDEHKEKIIALRKNGSTQVYIAKKYGTTQPNLFNWLRKHKLADVKPVY